MSFAIFNYLLIIFAIIYQTSIILLQVPEHYPFFEIRISSIFDFLEPHLTFKSLSVTLSINKGECTYRYFGGFGNGITSIDYRCKK